VSIQAVAWALEQDLPARPKLVLVSIANHADHTNGYCWLKAETIAAEAACTVRSVYRFVGGLRRNGYLRRAPRKGADGKQRANDYWLLFDRAEAPWDWGASTEDDDINAVDESAEDAAEPQDVDEPHDTVSLGETASPGDTGVTRQGSDVHAVSRGPGDSGVSRYMNQPSKTNPKETEDSAPRARSAFVPRNYKPPPPEPQGSTSDTDKRVFVYEGTRAWDAWVAERKRTRGVAWTLTTTRVVDGKSKRGWWFPSLFPPDARPGTGPPTTATPAMSPADEAEMTKAFR